MYRLHMILSFVGECPESAHCNYIHKTMGLLSDMPHITAEAIIDLIENIFIFGVGYLFSKNLIHREFDRTHNISHEEY